MRNSRKDTLASVVTVPESNINRLRRPLYTHDWTAVKLIDILNVILEFVFLRRVEGESSSTRWLQRRNEWQYVFSFFLCMFLRSGLRSSLRPFPPAPPSLASSMGLQSEKWVGHVSIELLWPEEASVFRVHVVLIKREKMGCWGLVLVGNSSHCCGRLLITRRAGPTRVRKCLRVREKPSSRVDSILNGD